MMGTRHKQTYTDPVTGEDANFFYHIISVDSTGINYINVPLSRDPQILITNPSNPVFLTDRNEIGSTRGDGHVRTLIFSNGTDTISQVDYKVDNGEWEPMMRYGGASERLWESFRTKGGASYEAIPDDGKDHSVRVRVIMESGEEWYQDAISTSKRKLVMVWELIIIILIVVLVAIAAFMNKDNFPLKRADGMRRRLSKEEKGEHRKMLATSRNKPEILSLLFICIVIGTLTIPWGVFPVFQGGYASVFPWFMISMRGIDFFSETLAYASVKIILGMPILFFGLRKYVPESVFLGSLVIFGNAAFVLHYATKAFASLVFTPVAYLDIFLSGGIFLVNLPRTWGWKKMLSLTQR
jgi:hypothetical protein